MTKFMRGAGEQHRDPLPHLLPVHRVRSVLGCEFVDRRHAGDVAEAAERNGLDAVLGVAEPVGPHGRPHRRAEADEVAPHLHPGGPRHPHVSAFVQRDRHQNGQCEQHDADHEHHRVGTTSCAACARLGPGARPALRLEYVFHGSRFGRPLVGSAQHLGDGPHDRREPDPPGEERRRRLLVGRVVDRGQAAAAAVRPAGPARRPGTPRRPAARTPRSRRW